MFEEINTDRDGPRASMHNAFSLFLRYTISHEWGLTMVA